LVKGEEVHIQAADTVDDRPADAGPDGVSTLRHYLHALWRQRWLLLVPLVLLPVVTFVASVRQEAVYEASADVLVNRQEAATTSVIGQTPVLDDPDRTMDTQVLLASVPEVLERTIEAAGATDLSPTALLDHSTVFPLADILRFNVSDEEPGRAATLASEYARSFVDYRRELDTVGLESTLAQVRRQIAQLEAAGKVDSPLYLRLADREQQLESLKALRTSNVSVVQAPTAGDAEQVAPRPRRNAALALLAGLLIGLVLVFLRETLSTRPRSAQEYEALLGMPFLARLTSGPAGPAVLTQAASGPEADAVHTLRANLELASSAVGARTILITSPHAGEGKSATTAQLGVALARAGRRVTLVDLDLRESALTQLMGLDSRRGITTLVRGDCELTEALVSIPLDQLDEQRAPAATNGRRDFGALLEVVGSGPRSGHPSEILSSKALAPILSELEQRADIVLVEAAPLLDAPDAASVAACLDGLLLVVSARDARGPVLADVRRTVDPWPLAKLGFGLTDGGDARPHGRQLRWGKATAPTTRVGDAEQVA
jgi:Mrp family chromosome partitioning ATPase